MKTALIDGDSIIYILAWTHKEFYPDSPGEVDYTAVIQDAVDQFVIGILAAANTSKYLGALGDQTQKSFRYEWAKYKPYKGTRKPKDEWVIRWEQIIRERLITEWKFCTVPGLEADDIVGLMHGHYFPECIVCSPDKDLRQLPGSHFDYKKTEFLEITELEADYNFAYQMLVGDDTDNVAGLPGIGEKKAKDILSTVDLSQEFYIQKVRSLYRKYFGEHYGVIIFEENLAVLGLITSKHEHSDPRYLDLLLNHVQIRESQNSAKLVGWMPD